jgi:hypothetical protein
MFSGLNECHSVDLKSQCQRTRPTELSILFGLDTEVWSIIASFSIFAATSALTISTAILAWSSRKQEKLIVTQTKALIAPRIAIRRAWRITDQRAKIKIRNVGTGTAVQVKVNVSWGNSRVDLPDREVFSMGPGDERNPAFDLPENVRRLDLIVVEFQDVLGNQLSVKSTDREVHRNGEGAARY